MALAAIVGILQPLDLECQSWNKIHPGYSRIVGYLQIVPNSCAMLGFLETWNLLLDLQLNWYPAN